jgi:iron complex transport system ATP-binding protein
VSLLELRKVWFAHQGRQSVLRNLSLEVEEGSIAAILGPNGSGKTTLLDICLGWRRPARGDVVLKGRRLADFTRRERGTLMSLVPQRENVRFEYTVMEYVLLGRAPYLGPLEAPGRVDERIAREALAAAGIARLAQRSIATLSGGEYQLMLIARSLAQSPALLLLDEPASQLDPGNQLAVIRLLKSLRSRGITVVYTSHNPQAAAIAADTIHMLKNGNFAASGPPREVLTGAVLQRVYGVPFRVSWKRDVPHVQWDEREEKPRRVSGSSSRTPRASQEHRPLP